MSYRTEPCRRTFVEISVTVAASSINVALGVVVAAGMFAEELLKAEREMWKDYLIHLIKLPILLLYPSVILILSKYQDMFITNILFGVVPSPIEGFGAAVVLFLLHLYVNMKLFN